MSSRLQFRMWAAYLAVAAVAATSSGCVVVGVPVRPEAWPAVAERAHREPSAKDETSQCPVIDGTFAVSGQKSGVLTFFWFVPIWWSSNKDSVARLDKDLIVQFERRATSGWPEPTEIEGAIAITLEQRGANHVDITVLREDERVAEEFERSTFANPSFTLDKRARTFSCNKESGRFEFDYVVNVPGSAVPQPEWYMELGRASDGTLLVKRTRVDYLPLGIVWSIAWHRYEVLPDAAVPANAADSQKESAVQP